MPGRARLPVAHPQNKGMVLTWATQIRALACFNRALVQASEEEHR